MSEPITHRKWADLSYEEQERIRRLLEVDEQDNIDDVLARCERALQILRGDGD